MKTRNQLCPCGSGLKFKRCHGAPSGSPVSDRWSKNDVDTRFEAIRVGRRTPKDGHRLNIMHGRLTIIEKPGIYDLADLGDLGGSLLQVCGLKDGELTAATGTAFMIAPGIAITAAHVLDELEAGGYAVEAIGPGFGGSLTWWRAVMIYRLGLVDGHGDVKSQYDLAAFTMEPVSDQGTELVLVQTVVSPESPRVGDDVMVLGFRAENGVPDQIALMASRGRVVQCFPNGRDRSMLPNPCFEAELDIWGGMSGGAVVNSHGELVGIASTSVTAISRTSYVSLLTPIDKLTVRPHWPPGWYDGEELTVSDAVAQLAERCPPPPSYSLHKHHRVDLEQLGIRFPAPLQQRRPRR